jgi:hypothetical protein
MTAVAGELIGLPDTSSATRATGVVAAVFEFGAIAGIVLSYTMRGYDTNLTKYVYWRSDEIDDDASEYSGNPAGVQDIVLFGIEEI